MSKPEMKNLHQAAPFCPKELKEVKLRMVNFAEIHVSIAFQQALIKHNCIAWDACSQEIKVR